MDQTSQEELKQQKLEQEQQSLVDFLQSDGYKAAQKVNQESIDENVQALVDTKFESLKDFCKLLDILADTRVKLNFRSQFTDRLSEIESELNTSKKKT